MKYVRMPIEIESPEQMGYEKLRCNLTESSFADTKLGDLDLNLNDLVLCYGDHLGKRELRELIAKEAGAGTRADDVIMTPGAAGALFMIHTAMLSPGDRLLVVRPNYGTNLETPRAIGCQIDLLELTFEERYALTAERVSLALKKDTKLVSITYPHNPTGVMISDDEMKKIVKVVEAHGSMLLVDETYREMAYGKISSMAATLSPSVLSVSSVSKTYGLPGVRMGWVICRNTSFMEKLLAAKEQIVICNSILDEEVTYRALLKKSQILPAIKERIAKHFEIVRHWFEKQTHLEWIEPSGGVVCFPRIKESSKVDVEKFYKILNEKYGTFVGPGHWFEQDRRSMRVGFGWPKTQELIEGLDAISKALEESR